MRGQPGGPSRRRRRTLRFRLTAGIVLLLTAAAVTIGTVTVLGLHRYLVGQLDGQLAAARERVVGALYGGDDDDDERSDDSSRPDRPGEVPGLSAGTLVVRVADDTTQAYVIAEGDLALGAQDRAGLAAVPTDGGSTTVDLDSGAYRVSAQEVGGEGDELVVGLPLHDLDETMASVVAIEGMVFAVVISVAAALAAVFVGRSLEPLRRVAGTATRVAELPLGSGVVAMPERTPDLDRDSEVGQVSTALNVLLDHVEASFAERHATEERLRQFVADASHELRTPVSVISGYTQLAQRQSDDLPAATVKSLDRIEAETQRMATLVDDLLLLARLDSGRPLAREQVDLSRLAIDVVDDARAAGPDHRWRLDLPEDPVVVVGDQQRLHQVLANLAANARAHTPAGSTVSVRLREEDPAWVRVEVTDDGPGIPPELAATLFERFVRGEASRSRATGGSGLGLAIVHAVTTAHEGQVEVASEPGRTTFTIRLPVAGPHTPGAPAGPGARPGDFSGPAVDRGPLPTGSP